MQVLVLERLSRQHSVPAIERGLFEEYGGRMTVTNTAFRVETVCRDSQKPK